MTTGLSPSAPPARGRPRLLSWIIGIVVVLLLAIPLFVGIYTDWLWFGELDFRGVFTTTYVTRIVLFLVFGLVAGLVTWAAAYFTWKGRPDESDALGAMDLNSPVYQYRQNIERSVRGLLIVFPVIVGLVAGFLGQGVWRDALMMLNSTDFGVADQQFGRDYAFYAFNLPMIQIIVDALSTLLIVAFLVGLVGHYMLGSIRLGNQPAGIKGSISSRRASSWRSPPACGCWSWR